MNFKQNRIRKRRLQLKQKLRDYYESTNIPRPQLSKRTIGIIAGVILLPLIVWAGFNTIKKASTDLAVGVISTIGQALPADDEGYTNFLLLGTGDPDHEGKDLTDSIIVASLHQKEKRAIMTSIPRDLFIKVDATYGQKINSIYANVLYETEEQEQAYAAIIDAAEQISGRKIHRYLRINFSTFEKIIDDMGGITINVPKSIVDTEYPDNHLGYQTFRIDAGLQTINGETALKYARSRHSTSDFDRSTRQQDLLLAIKENAKAKGILTSPSKIKKIYERLQEGIDTDLTSREIIELASIAVDFDRSQLMNLGLHDDPVNKGGFLYAPPRYLYSGAYVLRPLGERFDIIHTYLNLHYEHPEAMSQPRTLQILNGTGITGIATSTKANLARFGFPTVRYGNGDNKEVAQTTLFTNQTLSESGNITTRQGDPNTIAALKELINFQTSNTPPTIYLQEPYQSDADFILELGADFPPILESLQNLQRIPIHPPPPAEPEETSETNTIESTTTENPNSEPDTNAENNAEATTPDSNS